MVFTVYAVLEVYFKEQLEKGLAVLVTFILSI